MKKILFTPIGGTDPISNLRDGAMLHICRTYKPDEVYMYMSCEMLEYQQQDERYTKVLEWLGEKINHKFNVHINARGDMKQVHIFDAFIEEFEKEIKKIMQSSEEAKIFVNVSSGTPAMKSSLQLLTFMYPKLTAIQVATPEKKLNKNHENHEKYEVELQWKYDQDNTEYINRCIVSKASKLMDRITKEKIVRFIKTYNYTAAEMLVKELVQKPSDEFCTLLSVAQSRIILDLNSISKKMSVLPKNLFPIREGDKISVFEYLLALMIKAKKKEYADFIRAITPLTTDLMERVMVRCCGIKTSDFAYKNKDGVYKISISKLEKEKNKEIKNALAAEFGNIVEREVTSIHYKIIICHLTTDQRLDDLVTNIRKVESKIRNMAAHQIVSVTEDYIVKHTGFTVKQIIDQLKQLMIYSGINVKTENWDSYDYMNEELIKLL